MEKYILKLIVIFSGISTGTITFFYFFDKLISRVERTWTSTVSLNLAPQQTATITVRLTLPISMLSPLNSITDFDGRRAGYRKK